MVLAVGRVADAGVERQLVIRLHGGRSEGIVKRGDALGVQHESEAVRMVERGVWWVQPLFVDCHVVALGGERGCRCQARRPSPHDDHEGHAVHAVPRSNKVLLALMLLQLSC